MLVVSVLGGGRVRTEDPWGWMASQFLVGYSVPNGTFRCIHKHAHTQTQKADRKLGVQWTQGQKWAGPGTGNCGHTCKF